MSIAKFSLSVSAGIAAVFAFAAPAIAAATQVNIVDPTNSARVAHVDAGNRLAVQEVPPSTFFHNSAGGVGSGSGCTTIAVPPSGKALVVRQIRVNVTTEASPGNNSVLFYTNPSCSGSEIGSVTPPTYGLSTETFDPGLAIPAGGVLSAVAVGSSLVTLVYVDGYTVAPSVAPVAAR